MPVLGDLLSALTDPVGSLYYHWVVNLALLIAWTAAYRAVRRGNADRSLTIATGGPFLLRAIYAALVLGVMVTGALATLGGVLAVVEEGVEALSLALIAWALSPIPARWNTRAILLVLLVVLFTASGLAFALPGLAVPPGLQIVWWTGWQLALAAWAALALLLRRPTDWVLALGIALALLAGHAARLLAPALLPQPAPTVRLAQLVALPLLALFAVRRASAPPAAWAMGAAEGVPEAAPPPGEVAEQVVAAEAELQAELERTRAEAQRLSLQLQELERRAERDRQLLLEMGKLLEAQLAIPPAEQEAELARLRETLARREAELAALRERLAQMEGRAEAEARAGASARPLNLAAMAAMAQQLRQPLAVIAGYTHLIASESLGPLDPQQKRFLARTEEQVMHLTQLLDDLVQSAAPGGAAEVPAPAGPASAVEAIEAGISRAGPDMRQKRITLKMDIADSLPMPRTDYRTLSEIVSQLISHVCMASPMEGEMSLIAHPEVSPPPTPHEGQWGEGLLIRVWSQVETEPDLSAVASLVEAQGGRIWLEREANARVASVLLPVNGRTEAGAKAGSSPRPE